MSDDRNVLAVTNIGCGDDDPQTARPEPPRAGRPANKPATGGDAGDQSLDDFDVQRLNKRVHFLHAYAAVGWVGDRAAEDAAFPRAADLAGGFLRRRAEAVRARLAADAAALAAHARSADPRILELDGKLPWEGPVFAHALPVLYAVYPVPSGNWMVDAMPPEPGSFAQRLPLPEGRRSATCATSIASRRCAPSRPCSSSSR